MIVAINPGHYKEIDPGAVGQGGTYESHVCLAIAQKLQELLPYQSTIIESNDLQDICTVANNLNADLFVSIHANAANSPNAHGTETFFHPSSEKGQELAEKIHEQMVGLGLTDRGTKTMKFYVLAKTNMPAVLVETAFISNQDEEALLASDEGQTRIAQAIVQGIKNYIEEV